MPLSLSDVMILEEEINKIKEKYNLRFDVLELVIKNNGNSISISEFDPSDDYKSIEEYNELDSELEDAKNEIDDLKERIEELEKDD